MNKKKTHIIIWLLLIAVLLMLPKWADLYYTSFFLTFAVFAVYAVSLNMLLGYTGLLSFGHATYFGMGGYGTALALKNISGLSLLPAIGIGVLSASVLAIVVSPIVARVRGAAFAMIHLALGMFMYTMSLKLRRYTGGEDGLGNFPTPGIEFFGLFSISMEPSSTNFYYLAVTILGVSVLLMWFFTKTPFGQVQIAIRDNQKRIAYLGYRIPHSRSIIYITAGLFAGVAGSIYAVFHNLVSADGQFGILVSFTPILASMLGGIGSFFGPILGTGVFMIVEEIALEYTSRIEIVVGALLVFVIMFMPYGIMGFIYMLRMKWASRRTGDLSKEAAA